MNLASKAIKNSLTQDAFLLLTIGVYVFVNLPLRLLKSWMINWKKHFRNYFNAS